MPDAEEFCFEFAASNESAGMRDSAKAEDNKDDKIITFEHQQHIDQVHTLLPVRTIRPTFHGRETSQFFISSMSSTSLLDLVQPAGGAPVLREGRSEGN